jgi:hypothetical protein
MIDGKARDVAEWQHGAVGCVLRVMRALPREEPWDYLHLRLPRALVRWFPYYLRYVKSVRLR